MDQTEIMSASENEITPNHNSEIEREPAAELEFQEETKHDSAKEKSHKREYDEFLAAIDQLSDPEAKLQKVVAFMESSLSQGATPHFKSFWDARALCLELFKQNISPTTRALLWTKYTELSKEARRLKEILEEQSAFAAEQIEIAIAALEKQIAENEEILKDQPLPEFQIECRSLATKMPFYQGIQKELNFLNAQAVRINALRKELMKTEMRIRQKNKFFQRLSVAGDKVFPRRKERIKEASQAFTQDVENFIRTNFAKEEIQDSLFFLREEIKALQGLAKLLTLNTQAFTQTRLQLSECWDKIKGCEKERKKERAQLRVAFKENMESVQAKIQEFNNRYATGELNAQDAGIALEDISNYMRQIELGRDELKILRDELSLARKPLLDKLKQEEQEKLQQEIERDNQRRKKQSELKQEVEDLLAHANIYDADKIATLRSELGEKIANTPISKQEKLELERLLKPLRDIIAEKKEHALLALSDDDRQALQSLKELLKEKKERRQEVETLLKQYRKSKNSSGLDFEQAMSYNEQIASEKEHLEKIIQSISEIENKIDELE